MHRAQIKPIQTKDHLFGWALFIWAVPFCSLALLCIHPVFMYNIPVQCTTIRQRVFTSGHVSFGTEENSHGCVDLPSPAEQEKPRKKAISPWEIDKHAQERTKEDGLQNIH